MRPSRPDDFRLPDLRFVPVDSLVPHEQHDTQRMGPLVERFREQAMLKNPPVVTPLPVTRGDGDGELEIMVLDGANRSTAAKAAGLPHIVVQVARYEEPWVELSTWHHALADTPPSQFESNCRTLDGLECRREPLLYARAQLARRDALAYAVHDDSTALVFHGHPGLGERNRMLNAIVDTYRSKRFYRMSTETVDVMRERHPDATVLMVFPHFEPAEVLELATDGERLPAGITRHLIRWRALRVNVPMSLLADPARTLDDKNAWLDKHVRERFDQRAVRFYEEPTVLFDE